MTEVGVELLAVMATGIGAAALFFAGVHLLRELKLAPPRWLLPTGFRQSMVTHAIWNNCAWYDRVFGRLYDDAQILMSSHDSQPWASWRNLAAVESRLSALRPPGTSDIVEGIRQAGITLHGPTSTVRQEFDCTKGLICLGRCKWSPSGPSNPAWSIVCGGGR